MRLVAISDPECGGEVLMVKRDIVINRPTVAIKVKDYRNSSDSYRVTHWDTHCSKIHSHMCVHILSAPLPVCNDEEFLICSTFF